MEKKFTLRRSWADGESVQSVGADGVPSAERQLTDQEMLELKNRAFMEKAEGVKAIVERYGKEADAELKAKLESHLRTKGLSPEDYILIISADMVSLEASRPSDGDIVLEYDR